FDGVLGEGDRPNRLKLNRQGRPDHLDHNYQTLMALRQKYPRHQVRVLNIFGDKKDGTHSDGDVSNASAQSLRYLIGSRALSYQEIKISGRNGQHSRLHENKQVDRILMHFLWNK
ncbi:alpha/beta hydrolase, partial [Lactobacillus sp. XV13L]|nr:alpha/beta hydrolase [Lactobacillus sp. XV13L]